MKDPPPQGLFNQGARDVRNDTKDLSPQHLFNQVSRIIAGAKTHQYLTYENIDPATGSLVTESLDCDQKVERIRPR